MKQSRVKIYDHQSKWQREVIASGGTRVWTAVDQHHDDIFESESIDEVIEFANEQSSVTHITSYSESK